MLRSGLFGLGGVIAEGDEPAFIAVAVLFFRDTFRCFIFVILLVGRLHEDSTTCVVDDRCNSRSVFLSLLPIRSTLLVLKSSFSCVSGTFRLYLSTLAVSPDHVHQMWRLRRTVREGERTTVLFLAPFPFFPSSKRSLNRSSTTTLDWCFLGRRNRGSLLRRAKRRSDMVGGRDGVRETKPRVVKRYSQRTNCLWDGAL